MHSTCKFGSKDKFYLNQMTFALSESMWGMKLASCVKPHPVWDLITWKPSQCFEMAFGQAAFIYCIGRSVFFLLGMKYVCVYMMLCFDHHVPTFLALLVSLVVFSYACLLLFYCMCHFYIICSPGKVDASGNIRQYETPELL